MRRGALLAALAAGAAGHGAVTFPRPRNSLDAALQIGAGRCGTSLGLGKGGRKVGNGQACYWFSNGCNIGCDACDGTVSSAGNDDETYVKFLYKGFDKAALVARNMTGPAILAGIWAPERGDMVLDPRAVPKPVIKSNCGKIGKPTICEPRLRTLNTQAECGSAEDIYQLSPWRAPGSAPVIDSCGSAGGRLPGQGEGSALAVFTNSSLAYEGQPGSTLPPMAPQATWKAGSGVEVGWTVRAQHGGGYAYRLAPADGPLTEAAFGQMPLDFVGNSTLRWGGDASTQFSFSPGAKGWQTKVGTTPQGSQWRKNPIPRLISQWDESGPSFEPPCGETAQCRSYALSKGLPQVGCKCSGEPINLEIVDTLRIPKDTKPGKYVLGWRWDTEEGGQVWSSCSDVQVVA